jgi:GNAT superfamily N-acetyltransferase
VNPHFRVLTALEVDEAYNKYLEAYAWLNAKGVRQWITRVARQTFVERQARGELFACIVDGSLAAVVTMAFESSAYWLEEIGGDKRWWLKTLAVTPRFRGSGIGIFTMTECERHVFGADAGDCYLDCVDVGFLPGYYSKLGYIELARKTITYPSGNSFLVALMKKDRPRQSADQTT